MAWTKRACVELLEPQLAMKTVNAVSANVRERAFNERSIRILQKAVLVLGKLMGCTYRKGKFYACV